MAVYSWSARAACRGVSTEVFYPLEDPADEIELRNKEALAKSICFQCPVKMECLEYALETGERNGVWGGTTEKERRRLARQRRKAEQLVIH